MSSLTSRLFLYLFIIINYICTMKYILIILSLLILSSCEQEDSIDDKKFLDIYTEVLIARESTTDREKGTEEVNKVLAEHGMTEPEFRKTYLELSKEDPKRLGRLIDSIRNHTSEVIRKIDSVDNAKLEMEKDTNSATQPKE